jgi:glucose-1-phosphate cytidylyltransferase
MKVVLFCGGLGTRLREHSETIPKPLVPIGYRPIIWHLMRYYAHFGHKDFILCLGYRGDLIKRYFMDYDECLSNDFTMSDGGKRIEPVSRDISDWRITFVDTGLNSNIGERLMAVRHLLQGEEAFLANYADGLSSLPLNEYIQTALSKQVVASMLAVRTQHSFHSVKTDEQGMVESIAELSKDKIWINGGFFVLRQAIFDHMQQGEELVEGPFRRLTEQRQLYAQVHNGFWAAMDTLKDKLNFDHWHSQGDAPWEVWKTPPYRR